MNGLLLLRVPRILLHCRGSGTTSTSRIVTATRCISKTQSLHRMIPYAFSSDKIQWTMEDNKCTFHTTLALWQETTVNAPDFPDSIAEGDVKFTCKVGDSFGVDDTVMEIETDKTALPVPAPFAGTITALLVKNGDTVKSGQPLFKMKPGGKAPAKKGAAAPAPRPAAPAAASKPAAGGGARPETRVKMSRMRQMIAKRLKEAQNTTAMLTTFQEIDMSFAMNFRKQNQAAFIKKHGTKLGFMSIFSRASVDALKEQPAVNAVIKGQEIVYREYVDISIAVASPRGLVVPVIRDVDKMNYPQIEKALAALVQKARSDKITMQDMEGGTFTISNGGVFGSLMGTPIINLPQSGILGMHGIFERPIAVKGKVAIRPMMYVALTYDHRIIDGREAVLFLNKIKQSVEAPSAMLADL